MVTSAVLVNGAMPLCLSLCYLMEIGRLWIYVKYLVVLQNSNIKLSANIIGWNLLASHAVLFPFVSLFFDPTEFL